MSVQLLHTDCMEYMKTLPDKAFDLAIVDPPYGIGEDGGKDAGRIRSKHDRWNKPKAKGYKKGGWDNEPPTAEYFKELFRVSKNQIVWGCNHLISRMPYDSPGWIFWDKKTSGDFADGELAWTSFNCALRKFEYLWNGFRKEKPEERIHPTQKPVALYAWLLNNYAEKGWKILDTHLGSGSCAIAAEKMGFEFVGCEIDADYYAAAVERVKKETDLGMFQMSAVADKGSAGKNTNTLFDAA